MTARRILDRSVTPEWMSLALGYARSEEDPTHARDLLEIALRDEIESKTGRKKTVTVLTRAWLVPDPDARRIVAWAVEHAGGDLRPWHLGVLFANYPFFADACAAIGRQVALGDDVSVTSLRTTLKASWGDREVVDVASRGVVRTLRAFGVLRPTEDGAMDTLGGRISVTEEVFPWLVDALLVSRGEMEADTRQVAGAAEFFLFDVSTHRWREYPNLELFTEGGGRLVARRKLHKPLPVIEPTQLSLDTD